MRSKKYPQNLSALRLPVIQALPPTPETASTPRAEQSRDEGWTQRIPTLGVSGGYAVRGESAGPGDGPGLCVRRLVAARQ